MEPYTKEGLERREAEAEGVVLTPKQPSEYYQYNLVGIVVHQGTADCGHYYSFIQERASTSASSPSSSASGTLNNSNTSSTSSSLSFPSTTGEETQSTPATTKWFEFNDTNVLPFDPRNIGKESFGGDEELVVYDQQNQSYKKITRVKTNNAYILVYERSKFYVPKPKEAPSSPASSTTSGQASPITQPFSPAVVSASSTSSSPTEPSPPPVTDALGGDDESPEELVKNNSKEGN
jgi:hypothetical protein